MADADLNAGPARLILPSRHVTIQQSERHGSRNGPNAHPFYLWFKVAGVWLEEAGFKHHQRLWIQVEERRLVITPASVNLSAL